MKPTVAILGRPNYAINGYLISKLFESYNVHLIGTRPRVSVQFSQFVRVFKQNGIYGTWYYLVEKHKENKFLNSLVKHCDNGKNNNSPTFLFTENSENLRKHFIANQYSFVILGKSGIISSNLIMAANCKFVNVHPAKLPEYRGYAEPAHAIKDKRIDKIGATIHWVDEGIDSGSIVYWHPFINVEPKDLSQLLAEVRFNGFVKLVDLIKNTNFVAQVGKKQQTKYPLCKMLKWDQRKLTNQKFNSST
jgi:hypothetical protein